MQIGSTGIEAGDLAGILNSGNRRPSYRNSVTAESPKAPPPPAEKPELPEPTVNTLTELLAKSFPPIVWTVEGLLQRGSCDILAGAPKSGKSWLMLSIAVAVATGGKVLGSLPAVQGNVLYLAMEDGERRLQARVMQLLQNSPDADLSKFDYSCSWTPGEEGVRFIKEWIELQRNPTLIVVDTLQRIRTEERGDRGIYAQDYQAISPLADLAHSHNVGLVIVTHTRKSESTDVLMEVTGSAGITGAADGTMVLKRARNSTKGTLSVINRDAEDQKLSLELDHLLGGWRYKGDAEDVEISTARREVLDVLATTSKAMTPKAIAEALGLDSSNSTAQLLYKMLKQRPAPVERTDYGSYKVTLAGRESLAAEMDSADQTGKTDKTDHSSPQAPLDLSTDLSPLSVLPADSNLSESDLRERSLDAIVALVISRGGAFWIEDGDQPGIDTGVGPPTQPVTLPNRVMPLDGAIARYRRHFVSYVRVRGGVIEPDGGAL